MKQVLITIDTEVGELGGSVAQPFETFVEGLVDGTEYGYKKIITMLDAVQAPGEFFVDVYPVQQYGEERLANLCNTIVQAGHGVQLHTHPFTAYDATRRYLADYSPAEQKEIIQTGLSAIQKWTGKAAIAHRAGGYGLNQESLQVLQDEGVLFDSSYHFENPHCLLPLVNKNAPYKIGEVWEIPVSGYDQQITFKPFGPARHRFQKLDFRYGSTAQEISQAIEQAPDNSVHVIFLHSFNFLDLHYNTETKTFAPIHAMPKLLAEFEKLLAWVANQADCRFTGFNDLSLETLAPDYLVDVTTARPLAGHLAAIFQEKVLHTITT